MDFLLILLGISSFTLNGTTTRYFQLNQQKSEKVMPLYQFIFSLSAAFLFFAFGKFQVSLSLSLILPAMLFGFTFFMAVSMYMRCIAIGPMSLSSIIQNSSLIIPITYSIIFLNEQIQIKQIIAIILIFSMFAMAALSSNDKNNTSQATKKVSGVWFIMILTGFLSNGMCATIQKQYQLTSGGGSLLPFLAIAYLFASLLFITRFTIINKEKLKINQLVINPKKSLLLSTLAGIGSFGGNGLIMYLSTRVESAILYPSFNGGLCIVLSLVAFVLFKEKPSYRKLTSLVAGVSAIILLGI